MAVVVSCDVGWSDANQSVADGCETPVDPDPTGNSLGSAPVLGNILCNGTTYTISGLISNTADNDWYSVHAGSLCGTSLVWTLTSGGSPSTYASFDVWDNYSPEVYNQTSLSVTSALYAVGDTLYIRVHASGAGPYGPYTLTLHL